jgi:hypothetical protein
MKRWSLSDLRLWLCLTFYLAFTIYARTEQRHDTDFEKCLKRSSRDYVITTVAAALTSAFAIFALPIAKRSPLIAWIGTTVSAIILVQFAILSILAMRAKFQPSGTLNTESQFGFGQIMVFFMIFQLVVDFSIAMVTDFAKLHKDLPILRPDLREMNRGARFLSFCRTFGLVATHVLPAKILQSVWRGNRRDSGLRTLRGV